MFHIEFIDHEPELQEDGWLGLWGRITLGEYEERFLAPVGYWSRADYERQWLEAARRLLRSADRTGFFTAPYRFWWTMWRDGERVFVHEELITPERYAGPYDGTPPYQIIEDRVTHNDEGEQISEWEISLQDIRAYLNASDST